jgi:hypothetical protein
MEKINDVSSADENRQKMSLQNLYLKTIIRQLMYSSIEDSEIVPVFEHNNCRFEEIVKFCLNRQVTHLPS